MIECYSNNLSVNTDEAVTFNNTAIRKGCTVTNSGATIQFNRCGIYEVALNATAVAPSATSSAPADITLEVRKDGTAQPKATVSATAAGEADKQALSIITLIQVPANDTCSPCSAPTTCSVVNTGAPATFENINLVVTKLV